jgi:hypothetical protein
MVIVGLLPAPAEPDEPEHAAAAVTSTVANTPAAAVRSPRLGMFPPARPSNWLVSIKRYSI